MDSMKGTLFTLLEGLREEDINLAETPALFIWSYEEEPTIFFELLIKEGEEIDIISSAVH